MLSRVKRAGIKILGEETATDANLSIPAFRTRRVVGLEALLHFVRRQRGGGLAGKSGSPGLQSPRSGMSGAEGGDAGEFPLIISSRLH